MLETQFMWDVEGLTVLGDLMDAEFVRFDEVVASKPCSDQDSKEQSYE